MGIDRTQKYSNDELGIKNVEPKTMTINTFIDHYAKGYFVQRAKILQKAYNMGTQFLLLCDVVCDSVVDRKSKCNVFLVIFESEMLMQDFRELDLSDMLYLLNQNSNGNQKIQINCKRN